MNCKKLEKTIKMYDEGNEYSYHTIFNKGNCYLKALFVNESFDTFCIFEADINEDLMHEMPEEVIAVDSLDLAHVEWMELTNNYYIQN